MIRERPLDARAARHRAAEATSGSATKGDVAKCDAAHVTTSNLFAHKARLEIQSRRALLLPSARRENRIGAPDGTTWSNHAASSSYSTGHVWASPARRATRKSSGEKRNAAQLQWLVR